MFGVGSDAAEEEQPEPPPDEGEEDAGGDEGLDPVERLAQGRAAAGMAQTAGGGTAAAAGGGTPDPRELVQTQIDRVNHVLLVEVLPEVVAIDVSSFGLTTVLTLPLVYWPIAALWGLEVFNDVRGESTPLTPKLSWKSFAPPGTEIDIPLPNQPLWVAWIAYVILIGFLSVVWLTLIAIFVYTISDPTAAVSGIGQIFPFISTITGI